MRVRLPQYPIRAAHPIIAGLLCQLAANFADSAEPIFEHPVFIIAGIVAAAALLIGRAFGFIV
jgi:hypothetical protein